jgi:hypothetical protein
MVHLLVLPKYKLYSRPKIYVGLDWQSVTAINFQHTSQVDTHLPSRVCTSDYVIINYGLLRTYFKNRDSHST